MSLGTKVPLPLAISLPSESISCDSATYSRRERCTTRPTAVSFALRHRPDEVRVQRDRQHEYVGNEGVDGEERGVVEHLEVEGAVDGIRRVEEVAADLRGDDGLTFGHAHDGLEEVVDRRGGVHPLQLPVVLLVGQVASSFSR